MGRKAPAKKRQRAGWLREITEAGVTVRVFEWRPGLPLYREVRVDGKRDRRSLGHRDRELALTQARTLARRLAELRFTGHAGTVTIGQLWRLYQQHRLPQLSAGRQAHARQHAGFWLAHLGDAFPVENFSQTHLDTFTAARRSGTLRAKNRASACTVTVRDDTIRQNVNWLAALFRFARGFKAGGRPVLSVDPMQGLKLPREKNVRRPVATLDRYQRTAAKAPEVDPSGRLACVLALARYTGRRINAILNLRATDLLLSAVMLERRLAATGQDPALVRFMPHGAIHWRAELDKQGFEDIAPLSREARQALDVYLRAHPRAGEVQVFPARFDDATAPAWRKAAAAYYLRRAESAAELPHLERGGFHSYRRLFASERKHLPDVDVAKAGGWRDLSTMKRSYQQPDPATVLRAIENPAIERSGQDVGKVGERSADSATG